MQHLGSTDSDRPSPWHLFARTDSGAEIRGVVDGRTVSVYRKVRHDPPHPGGGLTTEYVPAPEDFTDRRRWKLLSTWQVQTPQQEASVGQVRRAAAESLYEYLDTLDAFSDYLMELAATVEVDQVVIRETDRSTSRHVPQITQEHVRTLLSSRATYAVLWIDPMDPMKLNLWDCDDPAPGVVVVRVGELHDIMNDGYERSYRAFRDGEPEPELELLDTLQAKVVTAARAVLNNETEA